jgi:Flp pilus assembly protein TadD
VRIEAARGLAGPAEARLAAGDRPRFDRAIAEFAAVQTYNADRPEGCSALGNLYAVRGDPEAAIAQFRKAIEIDPAFVPAYVNLADLYRARGAESDAEAILRAGIAKAPTAAPLRHALGLALVRQKRSADAVKALAEAARLDPSNGRYAYVYAVAVNDAGDARRASTILEEALRRHPYDRDVLFGLALYAQQAGRRDAALRHATLLRELEPENPEIAQLVARLEGRPPR